MKNEIVYKYIVIGAGASGLFFAANAVPRIPDGIHCVKSGDTEWTAPSLILEKTAHPGTKLLMSGGGHANITHAGSIKDFIPHYGNGKLIRRVLYKHNNLNLMKWLTDNGVPTITEDDGRVFPASKRSDDILRLLLKKSQANGFTIKTNSQVVAIEKFDDLWSVRCSTFPMSQDSTTSTSHHNESNTTTYIGKHIIIATGGCSYPKTGSDGSIFEILKRDLDLTITDLSPALAPISVEDYPYSDLSGISLDASITISDGMCRGHKSTGAILFAHNSLSGPAIINISGSLSPGDRIKINYLYPMNYKDTFDKLQSALIGNKAQLATIVSDAFNLPKNFSRIVTMRSGNSTKSLSHLLTEDEFTIKSAGSFDTAMATRGGIALDEVNLSTMELIKCPGIFVIGEALDVDGETGGYNLQFAYSSALCALDSLL